MTERCIFPIKPSGRKVLLEITNRCDANCQHCCNRSSNEGGEEISHDRAVDLLDELVGAGFNQIYFSGGEPLLRSGFLKLLEEARHRFDDVKFSTNGNLLDSATVERVAKYRPDSVGVSIDSACPEEHDRFREVPGLFKNATAGLAMLAASGVNTRVQCTITSSTYNQVEALYRLGSEVKAHAVLFQFAAPSGRTKDNVELAPNETQKAIATRAITELALSRMDPASPHIYFRLPSESDSAQGDLFSSSCPGGDRFFHIRADGRVSPCSWASKFGAPPYVSSRSVVDSPLKLCLAESMFAQFRQRVRKLDFSCNSISAELPHAHLAPCPVVVALMGDEVAAFETCRGMIKGELL